MYGTHGNRGDQRGRDPSGHDTTRGIGHHNRTSNNILEELQNIEQALSMVSQSTYRSQDWHDNNTPPRHNRSIARSNNSNDDSSRDPPLSHERHHNEYYQQRFASHNSTSTTPPRSSLVRFSEQLEVYSKHVTCNSANSNVVPILRTKSGSGSNTSRKRSTPQHNRLPSSGGSRDPTPRSRPSTEAPPAEPAGIAATTTRPPSNAVPTSITSDPPVDRSNRRLLASPAGLKTSRVTRSEPRPVSHGSLSLHDNTSGSWSAAKAQRTNDMELNPRRLASEFYNISNKQPSLTSLKQDLAPTPNNHRQLERAPTPNRNKSSTDWVLARTMSIKPTTSTTESKQHTPSPKTWSMANLFANPCQSPFTTSPVTDITHTNSKPLLPPISSIALAQEQNKAMSIPSHLSIPSNMSSNGSDAAPTPIRERTHKLTQRWREQDELSTDDDGLSSGSAESASALLIGNNRSSHQWERGPILQTGTDENQEETNEDQSLFSEATPSSLREMLESRDDLPVHRNDSRLYEKMSNSATKKKPRNNTKDRQRQTSYLQLGDEGSLQQNSVGTEIMALPKSIEVRIEGYDATSAEKEQSEHVTQDCMGGVLQRFRSKKVPFQELDGDVFSCNESFDIDSQGNEYIIKKATSETEDTDSGIHVPGRGSSWDRFDRECASDCDDDEILISTSLKQVSRRRYKRMWMVWVLVCSVVICLAVGLPVYFSFTHKEDRSDSMTVPVAPTESPIALNPIGTGQLEYDTCILLHGDHASNYSERYFTIRQLLRLMSVGRTAMIDQPETPQRKALCWLAEDDAYSIDASKGNEFAVIQRYSLAVLYHSFVSADDSFPDSLSNTDFLSATPECEWDVIMCSEPGVVSALLLSDKNLNGRLPPEIGNLEGLTFLEMSLNQMTGSIPSAIQQLTALEYLALSFNELSGSLPSVLGRMTSLQYLNMRSSQIVGTIPSELGKLSKLESLLLEGNKLTGTIPSSLGNLYKSQQMSFRRNYLSGRVAVELCELRNFGELVELTVDYWIACDCCTSS